MVLWRYLWKDYTTTWTWGSLFIRGCIYSRCLVDNRHIKDINVSRGLWVLDIHVSVHYKWLNLYSSCWQNLHSPRSKDKITPLGLVLAVNPASIQSAEHMPRACCLLRISGDIIACFLSLFLPIELLRSSRKKHIAAAVEGGFDGILDDTDDESFSILRKKKLSIFQI